jgi:hypothetical protein
MSDDTNVDINLDDFEKTFFGGETPVEEAPDNDEPEVPAEEPENDELEPEDNSLATDEDETPEEEDEPQPEKPKSKAQQRIEKLLERERLANERADALERRLAALEAQKEVKEEKAPDVREQLPTNAPNPDATDDDGNPVYPLGEFDPNFIRDLTKFTIEEERKAAEIRAAEEAQAKAFQEAREQLASDWSDKITEFEKEVPEIRENILALTEAFSGLDENYGDYLATTIMACEAGPEIMHYLSQNIGEAQKIVASGPAAATLAIGRLEARLMKAPSETKSNKKVSDAPTPPEDRTRGSNGKFVTAPDTDDLSAFEREFFK